MNSVTSCRCLRAFWDTSSARLPMKSTYRRYWNRLPPTAQLHSTPSGLNRLYLLWRHRLSIAQLLNIMIMRDCSQTFWLRHRERYSDMIERNTCPVCQLDGVATHGPALNLRHVQIPDRKHAERLEQLACAVGHREDHAGLEDGSPQPRCASQDHSALPLSLVKGLTWVAGRKCWGFC